MPVAVTTETVEAKVIETIASFGPEPGSVTRAATFDELDVDSLDLVELAQVVEERWGLEIRGEDARDVRTVGDAIAMIVNKADSVGLAESGALDGVTVTG